MKAKEIRKLSTEDAEKQLGDIRSELVNLRVRKQVGQIENTSELNRLRRDIARFETILNEAKRAPQETPAK